MRWPIRASGIGPLPPGDAEQIWGRVVRLEENQSVVAEEMAEESREFPEEFVNRICHHHLARELEQGPKLVD
jgi:hypothetical protein